MSGIGSILGAGFGSAVQLGKVEPVSPLFRRQPSLQDVFSTQDALEEAGAVSRATSSNFFACQRGGACGYRL